MAEDPHRPILNPVLSFRGEAIPGRPPRGRNSKDNIKVKRLEAQRKKLIKNFEKMSKNIGNQPKFDGHIIVYARMFSDSFAQSYTPKNIFSHGRGSWLLTPYKKGYLVQVSVDGLMDFVKIIKKTDKTGDLVDISRIKKVRFFGFNDALGNRKIDDLWDEALTVEAGKSFTISLMRLRTPDAVISLVQNMMTLQNNETISSPPPLDDDQSGIYDVVPIEALQSLQVAAEEGDRISLSLLQYLYRHRSSTTVVVSSKNNLMQLMASGSVYRIDPVVPISCAISSGGATAIPPLPVGMSDFPIVGTVDGGLISRLYNHAVAWRASPFVSNKFSATQHGSHVSSQIIQGHDWNTNLELPKLYCQIGVVQAVPYTNAPVGFDPERFRAYLDNLMGANPETRVWNFSMNLKTECKQNYVHLLSQDIAELARKHKVLPIISIGNNYNELLKPPADCEAAITVGGRLPDVLGYPDGVCNLSSKGPGPSGMLKPDISNFSRVQVIGGTVEQGSSFSAALTSPLAAHTMARLRDASPDMVKALLLHSADLRAFDPRLGFGTPLVDPPPWECKRGIVTLVWTKKLSRGAPFYWHIPIPSSCLKLGYLKGEGILTAVLNPHPLARRESGMNYFGARIEASLQLEQEKAGDDGKRAISLLGSLQAKLTEEQARKRLHKWSPVRRHMKKSFSHKTDLGYKRFRVRAHLFTRDLYLLDPGFENEALSFDVVFALSIGTGDRNDDIYSEMVGNLGPLVEPAVIEPGFDIETGEEE